MPSPSRARRSRDAKPPTDDQLIAWYENGELIDRIARSFDLPEPDQFREVACRSGGLTVSGKMDLLSLIESGAVSAIEGHAFFNVQQFYIDALPSLNEPVPRMLAAVESLVKLGGGDLAATLPNGALREWLRKDPRRGEAIISAAGDGDATAASHMTFALEVTGDPARTRSFLGSVDPLLKASAMAALSRLPDPDPQSRAASIQAIGDNLGDGTDDMLCANAIEALLAIASQDITISADLVLPPLRLALAARGDGALNCAAQALSVHKAVLRPEVAAALLEALLELNPDHRGTIDRIDMGLKALIQAGQDHDVLHFLAALLVKNDGRLKAHTFNSVWEDIVSGPPVRLSRWLITWLVSGESALGFAVAEVLAHLERDETGFSLETSELPAAPMELGYLARKAVGWFILKPHTATSILVAVLSVCDETTARSVAGLLVYPILRNYPDLCEVLKALPESNAAKPWVDAALEENDRYFAALRTVPRIPELTPSDNHRRLQHLHHADQMRAIHKSAQQQSIFFNLVRRSTLLYGVRTLTYVEDLGGGTRQPMEMELGTHEYSMTLPRLDMLDPVRLQFLLIRFRAEPRPR